MRQRVADAVRHSLVLFAIASTAAAQSAPEKPTRDGEVGNIEEIVVTGTLLRGVAPAGSEVVTMNEAQIAATGANTTAQLLASVPQSATFNARPNISSVNSTQVTINRPNLRNLPGTSGGGSSTLLLLDGHRLPGMGIRQTTPDLDAIAPGAIERVEIVLDGGSSLYGADAVGGVINLITRKHFEGVEAKAGYGFGDDYSTRNASLTVGHDFGALSAFGSYDYAWHDSLYGRDRDYVERRDYVLGLPLDLTCAPGNVSVGSATYQLPTLAPGSANRCDLSDNRTFYPREERHSVFGGVSFNLGSAVSVDVQGFYTRRTDDSRGPITATATIAPVNPFAPGFVFNPLYRSTGDANAFAAQSVGMDFTPVLGIGKGRVRLDTWGLTPSLTADLGHDWQLRFFANYGRGKSRVANDKVDDGALSTAVLTGAFDPYDLGSPVNAALLPALRALDYGLGKNELINSRAVADGSLGTLPGGVIKTAIGIEYIREKYESWINGTVAPSAVAALPKNSDKRNVKAAFAEVQVPIVGEGNRVGGLYSLSLSASGRYDDYSDFGDTFNPKLGLTYQPVEWLKLRGSWGKSFQAPSLADGEGAAPPTIFAFPLVIFANPAVAPVPGQAQIFLGGGGPDLKPQKSKNWSLGFDLDIPGVEGLSLNANYYNIKFKNLIDIPPVFDPGKFYSLFTGSYIMNPTIAQVQALASQVPGGLAQVSPFTVNPGQVYSIADGRRTNLASVNTDGVDLAINYYLPTNFGSVYANVGGNYVLGRKEKSIASAPFVNTVDKQTRFLLSTTVGTTIGKLRAQATWNRTGGWDVAPLASNLNQDEIASFDVVNTFVQYSFDGQGLAKDLALTFNIDNVFDKDPPHYNGILTNNDSYAILSIGRLFQLGISKQFGGE